MLLNSAVEQNLLLRGYRDFPTRQAYKIFLEAIIKGGNDYKQERLEHETELLKELPDDKWHAPQILQVRVSSSSIVSILGNPYSVPSRLINYSLKAYVYPDEIILFYGNKQLQKMRRIQSGETPLVNYRHIIDSLIRKPNAFENYKYKEALFPRLCFRKAYDALKRDNPAGADKAYLKLLQLAKVQSEQSVAVAIELLLEARQAPMPDKVKELIDSYQQERAKVTVNQPNLAQYDSLLKAEGDVTKEVIH